MKTIEGPEGLIEIHVSEEAAGQRMDKLVIAALGGRLGRAHTRELFAKGAVRVRGHQVSKGRLAVAGEVVSVQLEPAQGSDAAVPNAELALDVRLERSDVLVLHKPAGQPTAPVRPGETNTLANALVGHYPELASVGYSAREPGIVHRLDTDTSGLVVAARTAQAFDVLTAALRAAELQKLYVLICQSEGLADTGTIDIPLCPHPKDTKRVLACVHPRDVDRYKPRPASTSYRVLERAGQWALVEASAPKALRHQIRAHFAAVGHPLLGDELYGGDTSSMTRQALHAYHVSWRGSESVAAFTVHDDLPESFRAWLDVARRG